MSRKSFFRGAIVLFVQFYLFFQQSFQFSCESNHVLKSLNTWKGVHFLFYCRFEII